jgi:hypothetical protein
MRALSIRQPWAWAVLRGGKNVENRSRPTQHRGRLLIHAGQQYAGSDAQSTVETLAHPVQLPVPGLPGGDVALTFGAIIGAVEVTDCHTGCDGTCSPWAEPGQAHIQVRRPVVLTRPVACPGRLGVFTPDDVTLARVREVWPR